MLVNTFAVAMLSVINFVVNMLVNELPAFADGFL